MRWARARRIRGVASTRSGILIKLHRSAFLYVSLIHRPLTQSTLPGKQACIYGTRFPHANLLFGDDVCTVAPPHSPRNVRQPMIRLRRPYGSLMLTSA